jgi:predicted transcriptional regulator
LKDENKLNRLYESWVFYKILDCISDLFQIKFKEVTKYKEITFQASSDKIKNLIYQKNIKLAGQIRMSSQYWTDQI